MSWQSLLDRAGYRLDENGQPLLGSWIPDGMVPLAGFRMVEVAGEDATDFLQNMLSSDLRQLGDGDAQPSSILTPKGRIIALFLLVRLNDRYLLRTPASTAELLAKRLGMFLLRSRATVTLHDEEHWSGIGLVGDEAARSLAAITAALPERPFTAISHGNGLVVALPGGGRYEWWSPEPPMAAWDKLVAAGIPLSDANCWSLHDIRSGMPSVVGGSSEAFVPQMINLHAIGGVSFTKGCYPGQEVVARSQYLGKLKRHLYRARIAAEGQPLPGAGDRLQSADGGEHGADSGRIVSAARSADGSIELLAVIPQGAVDAGRLQIEGDNGRTLTDLQRIGGEDEEEGAAV